jgi:hypothetical protein
MELAVESIDLNTIFKKQPITSYGFVRLLFAKLSQLGRNIVPRDTMVENIYNLSKKNEYKKLFDDIGFRVFIDSVSSQELEDGISSLQTFGMIGKINPTFEKIIIFITEDMANDIVQEYEDDIASVMNNFVEDFVNLEVQVC